MDTKVSAQRRQALVWLAEGAAIALTEPGRAKDLLSRAADRLSGDLRDKARIWLACAYWSAGEKGEARIILNSVNPESVECKFLWGSTMASMVTVPEALEHLNQVAVFLNQIDDPLSKGRYFNQRGIALFRSEDLDGAIIAYTAAAFWFQEAGNPILVAVTGNNLAEVLSKAGQFEDAYWVIGEAIAEFERLDAGLYLAQARDTKALIDLAQQNYSAAAVSALQAVKFLETREHKELTARSLITEATVLKERGEYSRAHGRLEEAREIGDYLGNTELLFAVQWEIRELSKKMRHASELSLISISLKESSIRAAAKKMRINHNALRKLMKKHDLTSSPYKPT